MQTFDQLILRSSNPQVAGMLYLLSWMAHSDGSICEGEARTLREIAEAGNQGVLLNEIIDISSRSHSDDIRRSCELIMEFNQDQRGMMMQLAVTFALNDGYLTMGEGHILRLIADVLGFGMEGLDQVFGRMTGSRFPQAADPSSTEWWAQRESSGQENHNSHSQDNNAAQPNSRMRGSPTNLERLRDLAVLGLDEHASTADIKSAYRRLVTVHHPDKFSSLGLEAVKAAELSFRRIQSAYERLEAR